MHTHTHTHTMCKNPIILSRKPNLIPILQVLSFPSSGIGLELEACDAFRRVFNLNTKTNIIYIIFIVIYNIKNCVKAHLYIYKVPPPQCTLRYIHVHIKYTYILYFSYLHTYKVRERATPSCGLYMP